MKFGDVSHRGLTPFDVASLHDVPAYPLPGAALESLPAHVRVDPGRDGAVQMFAVYDRAHHRFEDVAPAREEQDFLERIAELVAGDCSLHEAVDWIVVEEAERIATDIVGQFEAGDRVNVAIEPESIATVDEATRETWLAEAVEHTNARITAFERGAGRADAAAEHYGGELEQIERAVTDAAAELEDTSR